MAFVFRAVITVAAGLFSVSAAFAQSKGTPSPATKIDNAFVTGPERADVLNEAFRQSVMWQARNGTCEVLSPNRAYVEEMLVDVETIGAPGGPVYERRVALVVGNSAYKNFSPLKNPSNDANSMSRVLRALGFTVYRGLDLTASELEECLTSFNRDLEREPADLSLFFYAGHGVQLTNADDGERRNFMLATDADVLANGDGRGFKQIDAVLNEMRDYSDQSVFFYDACRNDPLGDDKPATADGISIKRLALARPGAAAIDVKQTAASDKAGIFIAYASAPNRPADDAYEQGANHSPFTQALLNHIATPGYSLKQAMSYVSNDVGELTDWNQTPWQNSSLTKEVRLNGEVTEVDVRELVRSSVPRLREIWAEGRRHAVYKDGLTLLPGQPDLFANPIYEPLLNVLRTVSSSPSIRLNDEHPKDDLENVQIKDFKNTDFTSDGKHIISLYGQSKPNAAVLWSATTGVIISEIEFSKPIRAIKALPDEPSVLGEFDDNTWEIRRISDGKAIRQAPTGETCRFQEFQPSIRIIIAFCNDRTVVWNASISKRLMSLPGNVSLALSPDLRTAYDVDAKRILGFPSGQTIRMLEHSDFEFGSLSDDYITGAVGTEFFVEDISTGEKLGSKSFDWKGLKTDLTHNKMMVIPEDKRPYAVRFPDLKNIYSLSWNDPNEKLYPYFVNKDKIIVGKQNSPSFLLYDGKNGKPTLDINLISARGIMRSDLPPHLRPSRSGRLAYIFSPDERRIMMMYADTEPELIDLNLAESGGRRIYLSSIFPSELSNNLSDYDYMYSYYRDVFSHERSDEVLHVFQENRSNNIFILNTRLGTLYRRFNGPITENRTSAKFRFDVKGENAIALVGGKLFKWALHSDKKIPLFKQFSDKTWPGNFYVNDGLTRMVTNDRGNFEFWDLVAQRKIGTHSCAPTSDQCDEYSSVQITDDFAIIDTTVYRIDQFTEIRRYNEVDQISLSPDGTRVAIRKKDLVNIKKTADDDIISSFKLPTTGEALDRTELIFNESGAALLSLSPSDQIPEFFDGRARLYDVNTGVLRWTSRQFGSRSGATSARFSPDGNTVVIGGGHYFGSDYSLIDIHSGEEIFNLTPDDLEYQYWGDEANAPDAELPMYNASGNRLWTSVLNRGVIVTTKVPEYGEQMLRTIYDSLDDKTLSDIRKRRVRYWPISLDALESDQQSDADEKAPPEKKECNVLSVNLPNRLCDLMPDKPN